MVRITSPEIIRYPIVLVIFAIIFFPCLVFAQTTTDPLPNYELQGATTTKHIMVGGIPVTTIETKGTTTKTQHVHTDHLGSTNVTTNDLGLVAQSIKYQPFGEEKQSTGKNTTRRHYIGQTYDTDTSLSYLNARYYRTVFEGLS